METWKDIPGYEKLYQVSNTGRIKSLARKGFYDAIPSIIINYKEKILKPLQVGKYLKVILFKDKKSKSFKIHRLVAKVFVDNPDNKPEVNHLDEDYYNNNDWNLKWVTRKENLEYSKKITKSAAVISVKKIKELYKKHIGSLDEFVNIIINNSN